MKKLFLLLLLAPLLLASCGDDEKTRWITTIQGTWNNTSNSTKSIKADASIANELKNKITSLPKDRYSFLAPEKGDSTYLYYDNAASPFITEQGIFSFNGKNEIKLTSSSGLVRYLKNVEFTLENLSFDSDKTEYFKVIESYGDAVEEVIITQKYSRDPSDFD